MSYAILSRALINEGAEFRETFRNSQFLKPGHGQHQTVPPTVEMGQSLGEWVVRIGTAAGNTYSRAFEPKSDAVSFAARQRLHLGLQLPPPG